MRINGVGISLRQSSSVSKSAEIVLLLDVRSYAIGLMRQASMRPAAPRRGQVEGLAVPVEDRLPGTDSPGVNVARSGGQSTGYQPISGTAF